MDKLEPCPFCGSEDLEMGCFDLAIFCNKCGVFFTLENSVDTEEIKTAWNRRALNKQFLNIIPQERGPEYTDDFSAGFNYCVSVIKRKMGIKR